MSGGWEGGEGGGVTKALDEVDPKKWKKQKSKITKQNKKSSKCLCRFIFSLCDTSLIHFR